MRKILLFGAGKSATVLIDYLLKTAKNENWFLTIVDADLALAQSKAGSSDYSKALSFDISNEPERNKIIQDSDIVISLLPAALHFLVAKDCMLFSKNLLTASYLDDKIKSLEKEIERKGLLFLCEMGLDPGIDHMSAMRLINEIHTGGGTITSFKSHCGGLVSPESDNNPWHYKISWNPRNVVMAGKAGAVYKDHGKKVEIAYDRIFEDCPEVQVKGLPSFAAYPNRDSLGYAELYGLETSFTFIRTTLRYPSFCRGWDVICHLGLTDTEDGNEARQYRTVSEWFHGKLKGVELKKIEWMEYLKLYVNEAWHQELTEQLDYLDLFEEIEIPQHANSSADILQYLLEKRLVLDHSDRDMVVMLHEIEYSNSRLQEGDLHTTADSAISSSLVVKGEDSLKTAMARTVGMPLGIAARLILNGNIQLKGLHIPIIKEIYDPVLKELEAEGICFHEEKRNIPKS